MLAVPCEVIPKNVRQIAAPFEATVSAAHVEPGDFVSAGQLMVELDTKDKLQIVIHEVKQNKIYLDSSNEVRITGELETTGGGLADLNPDDL